MDNKSSWSSCTFELEDIEIIDHKNENEEKSEKWNCDQCSLFFLEKAKLNEHKKKHVVQEIVKCKYCNKTISSSVENRQCFLNRKCETCEYKCSKCPQRFLRRSSLMNHEKKHSSPKKKRATIKNKKVNGICTENVAVSKVLKKKQIQTDDSEEHVKGLKTKKSGDSKNSPKKRLNLHVKTDDLSGGIDNSPIKKPKRLSLKASKSTEETSNSEDSPVKVAKPKSQKSNQLSEEKKSEIEHIQKTSAVNSPAVSQTANMSSTENAVNYKPFSCHICGDTFASDSALIDHIKTHGENAARSFRCKFCGDEFGDIYKMQYHLAICPLAEDELESSLKQVLPANIQTKYSGGTLSPRKRGRPKKIVESPLDQECIENESTPSSSKRGNFRKRKSEVLENEDSVPTFTGSSLPKQSKNSKNKDSNRVAEEDFTDTSFCDITEVTKETEPDERKKLHQCPFPRCDFKFTREKALLCHMRNHSDDFEDSLKCHKCDIPFDDIQTLRLHINTCKGIKEERDDDFDRGDCNDSSPNRTFQRSKRDFVCNQCGRSHQSQEKLNRCTHEGLQTRGPMVCRICGEEAEDEKQLKKHFNSIHPKSFPYQCATCKAEFDSAYSEREHRMGHIQEGEQFTCVICSAKFPTYKELYFHYSKDHVEQSQSICKICNITFPNHMALEQHNYVMHQSEDRFKCIFCHKAYTSSVSLTTHMKTHTTKIFKCKICYRPFTDMATLFQHMLFHASTLGTERPLKCAVCLAAYAKQSALKYHISGHIAKNTVLFNCIICGEMMQDYESTSDHIFDHSIRITENNMTKYETEWVKGIKERKPFVKRGRLSTNNDKESKLCIKVERDDPEFKPNIKIEGLKGKGEETNPLNIIRGRGRPRKIKSKEKLRRPRKQSENQDSTLENTSVIKMNEGITQQIQQNYTTRRSLRLVEENNSGGFMANRRIKEEKKEKDVLIKKTKPNNKLGDKHSVSTTTDSKIASDTSSCKVNKEEERNLSSTKSKIILRRKSLKEKKLLSNNDIPNMGSNQVHEAKNKHSQKRSVSPEMINVSQARPSENKNEAMPCNSHPPLMKNSGSNDFIENKVRPMSFKFFSSLTNTRGHKVINNELRNDKFAEEVSDGKSSLINSSLLDVKEEMFDDEEDPLGGLEIPYFSSRKGLRSSHRHVNGSLDLDCPLGAKKKGKTTNHEESDRPLGAKKGKTTNHEESEHLNDSESRNSSGFIKEKKYFEPSRGLTKYSCTTCLSTFLSQEELLYHNTTHI